MGSGQYTLGFRQDQPYFVKNRKLINKAAFEFLDGLYNEIRGLDNTSILNTLLLFKIDSVSKKSTREILREASFHVSDNTIGVMRELVLRVNHFAKIYGPIIW